MTSGCYWPWSVAWPSRDGSLGADPRPSRSEIREDLDNDLWHGPPFLPVPVLSRMFRGLFLCDLQKAFAARELNFFSAYRDLHEPAAFRRYLAPAWNADCRVGGDVAVPTPHRPGRADFPHPVPHERDSLAAA
jgi:hypothetical protein